MTNNFITSLILLLTLLNRAIFIIFGIDENFFDFLPNIIEIKNLLIELFDYKLYSNVNGDQSIGHNVDIETSDEEQQQSGSSNQGAQEIVTNGEGAQETVTNGDVSQDTDTNGEQADSDSLRSDDTPECIHVLDPNAEPCSCSHYDAGYD